jgi:GDPmannose 4,6-dehydratase
MATALITGVTGQDGSYMAELLISKGYRVVGVVRDIKNSLELPVSGLANNVELVSWDMLDHNRLIEVLEKYQPKEIYNFAAYSSGSGMFDNPVGIGDINGLAISRILEAIRVVDESIRFCQASSSEMFGNAYNSPQSEETPFRPRTPYGAAKLYAHSMTGIYRQHYGLFGCSAILFNHESPRRGLNFVTRKITHEAAKIKLGLSSKLYLGNLDSYRDWGFAGDYVRAMWMMLQHQTADDYVVSTDKTHSVRNLCEIVFNYLGLNYNDYVQMNKVIYRPDENVQLVGDSTKIRAELNWSPEVEFKEMLSLMVDSDLALLRNN